MDTSLDIRALGAMRFVDATSGARVDTSLEVRADGVRLARNRSGAYVVHEHRRLGKHADAFSEPPAEPALGEASLQVEVRDPSGRYLARRFEYFLPRDARLDQLGGVSSLFHVPDVELYPAPAAPAFSGWTVIRARVVRANDGAGLPNVYLRLRRDGAPLDAPPLARGLADSRGEATVAIAHIPVVTWPEDENSPVQSFVLPVVLDAYFDASASSPPNPDELETKSLLARDDPEALPRASTDLTLTSGHAVSVRLSIAIPS